MRMRSGLCLLMFTPLSMTVEIPDSTQVPGEHSNTSNGFATSFKLGGGGGRYYRTLVFGAADGCGAAYYPVKQNFFDVGGEADRQFTRTWHVGVRGGYIHDTVYPVVAPPDSISVLIDRAANVGYGNFYLSDEHRNVGIGLGVLITSDPLHLHDPDGRPADSGSHAYPTGHLRLGNLSRIYVSMHLFEGVPLYSGGGEFFAGAGLRPIHTLELFGGYSSGGPYHANHWMGRVTADLNPTWTLQTMVRFPAEAMNYSGASYTLDEKVFGASVSLTYRMYRPGSN